MLRERKPTVPESVVLSSREFLIQQKQGKYKVLGDLSNTKATFKNITSKC